MSHTKSYILHYVMNFTTYALFQTNIHVTYISAFVKKKKKKREKKKEVYTVCMRCKKNIFAHFIHFEMRLIIYDSASKMRHEDYKLLNYCRRNRNAVLN